MIRKEILTSIEVLFIKILIPIIVFGSMPFLSIFIIKNTFKILEKNNINLLQIIPILSNVSDTNINNIHITNFEFIIMYIIWIPLPIYFIYILNERLKRIERDRKLKI